MWTEVRLKSALLRLRLSQEANHRRARKEPGISPPQLVINGAKDGLFGLDGVRASFDKLNASYKKAVPEKCRTRLYDTPYEFNSEMQTEAWEWLRRWM